MPGQGGAGTLQPIGMPGQGGAGTRQVTPITKEKMGQAGLDNAHIIQKELEVAIAN
jgi:hypothetical protein